VLSFFDSFRDINTVNILFRMVFAVICGGVIGIERSIKNRPAGFRTHILIITGAAAASLTGHYIYMILGLPTDMSRLGAQVITGLGFIGAGTIIVTRKFTIKGLTTAAGLWTTGIVGLAIGSGYYEGGILGTFLILFIQIVMTKFGKKLITHDPQYRIEVRYEQKHALDQVLRFCKDNHMAIVSLHIQNKTGPDDPDLEAVIEVRGKMGAEQLLARVETMEGILSGCIL
jgi:Uncharacterized membrane protein